jgi:hypothetical protein
MDHLGLKMGQRVAEQPPPEGMVACADANLRTTQWAETLEPAALQVKNFDIAPTLAQKAYLLVKDLVLSAGVAIAHVRDKNPHDASPLARMD